MLFWAEHCISTLHFSVVVCCGISPFSNLIVDSIKQPLIIEWNLRFKLNCGFNYFYWGIVYYLSLTCDIVHDHATLVEVQHHFELSTQRLTFQKIKSDFQTTQFQDLTSRIADFEWEESPSSLLSYNSLNKKPVNNQFNSNVFSFKCSRHCFKRYYLVSNLRNSNYKRQIIQ